MFECAVGKSWVARQGGSQTRSEHPGTAIDWQDEVYEVVSVEALAGTAVRYRLAPWVHGHAIRRIERYDEASELARHASRVETHTDSDKRTLAFLFSPILGHLPAAVQKRMEHDFGAPAAIMTAVSAVPPLILGVLGVIACLVAAVAGGSEGARGGAVLGIVSAYFFFESSMRLFYSAFFQREPMGSLPGHLAYAIWSLLRGRPASFASTPTATRTAETETALQDRYTMVEPLLALLSPEEQTSLERHFGFDPFKWGRRSSLLILFVAGANVLISMAAFRSGTDVFLDFAALVVGAFFVLEQISRRRRIAAGHPAGSVLGALVRPLARPLIEAARS